MLANDRRHRTIGCRPSERVAADLAAMLTLPPVAPVIGWRTTVRLPRDYYVRLDSNDYSVHPSVIGRRVEVSADLDRVTVTAAGRTVADHRRCWAKHQTITDPEHRTAADALRGEHRGAAARPRLDGPAGGTGGELEVEQRCLADYDDTFDLNGLSGSLGDVDGAVA